MYVYKEIGSHLSNRPIYVTIFNERICIDHHHHHQPINVPTARAEAFLMDYTQGEWAITHHAGQ
jgi:hypothetical protein